MRKSLEERRYSDVYRKKRRRRRLILWSQPLLVALVLSTFLAWHESNIDSQVLAYESAAADYEAEFQRLLPILEQRRIDREIAENEAVRQLVYEHTAAGYNAPPALTTDKCNYLQSHDDPAQPDVLVNKYHCLTPLGYIPDLTTVYNATIHTSAAVPYKDMIDAASLAGHDISSSSSYRSYADQAYTYRYWVSYSGRTEADTYSAYPGYSEHQTGFAVDLQTPGCVLGCFGTDPAYDWMKRNASEYGFIERYPDGLDEITGYSYEPWHWRYIGPQVSTKYAKSGAKTLEEYWDIP